jgi:serine/threonine protein kinase
MAVAQLKTGALFAGRFRIERVVGRGGMGTVYEVLEESTGERHALKVLAPHLVSDPKHRARFAKEAMISSEIQSAHIVPVVDAGIDEKSDTPWLMMELLRGESLVAFVRAHGKLDAPRAADVLGQVAEALGAAHAAGVIHRDLKPDNVFVVRGPDGSLDVRVLDFGIAKLASETVGRTTGAMGSPLWMAPEEAKKDVLTPAVDVWSFGLLAFYVLTGSELWRSAKDSNIAQALNEVLLEPIPNPILRAHAVGVTLPRGFHEWFDGCVVRDVAQRFANVADAWAPLGSMLRAPPRLSPAPPVPEYVPPPPPPPMDAATRRWLAIAGGVALSVLVLVLALATLGGPTERAAAASSAPSSVPASEDSVLFAAPDASPAPAADAVLSTVQACLARDDLACAHAALEAAVSAKDASAFHVQLLYDLCDLEADRECTARVAKLHPSVDRRPRRVRTLALPVKVVRAPPPVASGGNRASEVEEASDLIRWGQTGRARRLLEPVVFGKYASPKEVDLLWDICKKQDDKDCQKQIAANYPYKARE